MSSSSNDKLNTSVDDLEWEEWKPDEISFTKHMFAGSIAGLAEHIVMFPVDTIKTHLQCQRCGSSQPMQTLTCASRIVGNSGVFSLWRGVSAMFAGCIPGLQNYLIALQALENEPHAAYFGIFEFSKRQLGIDRDGHHPVKAAFCGAGASVSHDLFMTPFDTLKQRMQIGQYRTMFQCLTSLVRTEGLIALYLSFPMTFVMNIPYGGIMVAVNESMKKVLNSPGEEKLSTSLMAGSIAGGIAALLTTPLDVIKTRLQTQEFESPLTSSSSNSSTTAVQLEKCPKALSPSEGSLLVKGSGATAETPSNRPNSSSNSSSKAMKFGSSSVSSTAAGAKNIYSAGGYPNLNLRNVSEIPSSSTLSTMSVTDSFFNPSKRHKGVVEIVKRLLVEDGWRGFMRGAVARVLVQAPAAAISWTTYDFMKSLLNKQDIFL